MNYNAGIKLNKPINFIRRPLLQRYNKIEHKKLCGDRLDHNKINMPNTKLTLTLVITMKIQDIYDV